MPGTESDNPVHRAVRSVSATKWSTKAKAVAASLKAQHAAGREGDDSPAEPIWPTPRQQLEALKRLLRVSPSSTATIDAPAPAGDPSSSEPAAGDAPDTDAEEVAAALRGVNWTEVRSATSGKTNDVTKAMRAMSDHVDWAKVQPVAAQVSSALIAAVAAGRIPVGGRLGPIVAKAIVDQNNLAGRVAQNLERSHAAAPPDFRKIIEATATEL
jgi:hypothetical protein